MPFITPFNGKAPSKDPARRVEKGAVENARKTLMHVLEDRFGPVSAETSATLESIDDPHRLTLLMRTAVKAPSLKEFLSVLKG